MADKKRTNKKGKNHSLNFFTIGCGAVVEEKGYFCFKLLVTIRDYKLNLIGGKKFFIENEIPGGKKLESETFLDTEKYQKVNMVGSRIINIKAPIFESGKKIKYIITTQDGGHDSFEVDVPESKKLFNQITKGWQMINILSGARVEFIQKVFFNLLPPVLVLVFLNLLSKDFSFLTPMILGGIYYYGVKIISSIKKAEDDKKIKIRSIVVGAVIALLTFVFPVIINGTLKTAVILLIFPGIIFFIGEELTEGKRNMYPWWMLKAVTVIACIFLFGKVFVVIDGGFNFSEANAYLFNTQVAFKNNVPDWLYFNVIKITFDFFSDVVQTFPGGNYIYGICRILFLFLEIFFFALQWITILLLITLVTAWGEIGNFIAKKSDKKDGKEKEEKKSAGGLAGFATKFAIAETVLDFLLSKLIGFKAH